MKRFILSVLATTIACFSFAQLTGNGFYRIKNYGSGYYMWVCDNTGSIDVARTNADMGAIQLWEGLDLSISEVSSVLYFSNVSADYWNVQSQGTGVYELIKHYVQIHTLGAVDGVVLYQVYATEAGMTLYLSDSGSWGGDYHSLGTTGKGTYTRWVAEPIDANTDNYYGIKPALTVGDKYYAPFYADFAFSFASPGMKAYIVSAIEGNIAVLKPIDSEIIPRSTPVIIECSSLDKSENRLNLFRDASATIADNKLSGVYFCNEHRQNSKDAKTAFNAATMRVLHVNAEGKLVFDTATKDLHVNWYGDDGYRYLNSNQSYLPVAAGTLAELVVMTESEYEEYKANLKYTITYMVDGEVYKTAELKAGEPITLESAPSKEGYTFSGWSEAPETMPAGDVVITGSFSINSYKVTFMYGDNVLQEISVQYGATIPLPSSLESERYTLIEWLDVPATMPAHDVTINANYVDGINGIESHGQQNKYIMRKGISVNSPVKGVHVVRMSDGTIKKVMVR